MWGRWGFKVVIILFAIIGGMLLSTVFQNTRPNIGPWNLKFPERGSAYPEALIAALTSGPVQNDLLKRGLISLGTGDTQVSTVDLGVIQNLINQGAYFLDPQNRLQLGPVPLPTGFLQTQPGAYYIYSLRLTQALTFIDDFSYIGHIVNITIPGDFNLPADSKTTHNLYNTHLTLPDGRWVESGVGWVTWTKSPIIYTYQSYTGKWSFASIPGGVQRDIALKIEISTNQVAEMSASDLYSGKTIKTQQQVGALGHRVDESRSKPARAAARYLHRRPDFLAAR
jgi:hypothetical protein